MRTVFLPVALMPLITLACSEPGLPGDREPVLHAPATLSSAGIPDGPVSDTACQSVSSVPNEAIDGSGHFDTVSIVQADTGPTGDPDQCGDLTFNGRTRTVNATFSTSIEQSHNPYKYWWRRGRSSQTGTTLDLTAVLDTSVPAESVVRTGDIGMELKTTYDGVASVLILINQELELTDSAFVVPEWTPWGQINYRLQHWRHIESPLLDSARVKGDTVTLWWRNRHQGREVDSTIMFRDGQLRILLDHTYETWSDIGVSPGTHSYRVKHFTPPMIVSGSLAFPNSASSDTRSVYVGNQAPSASFTVACQQLPCTFTDSSSDPDGSIVSWRWTFGDGDSSSQQNPSHTYAQGGFYAVRLIVTDNVGAVDTVIGTAPPLQLFVSGPTVVKPKTTCEWYAEPQGGGGSPSYSWRVGGQELSTEEWLHYRSGSTPFQITLIEWAGDGQVDTAVVNVTISSQAPGCVLFR